MYDAPLSIAQRLTAGTVPTILAVRSTQTVHSFVGSPGLNCLIESLCSFWKVVRVQERLPTTVLEILKSPAEIIQKVLIEMGRLEVGVR